ncbi:MAG: hypothetical protein A3E82_06055 [Gammaproteobacteria bacterium RIFCSPHIGHO2_12_FULL_38_11]|nr:MAG: hypothetical protein A3E82_06055 [Gammaproteobacteria bacterium RIFCSPHIGHO2_12_FULL_38_11]
MKQHANIAVQTDNPDDAFIRYTLLDFTCPITHSLFFDPVSGCSQDGPCGHTFEKRECAGKLQKCPYCQMNITLFSAALLTKNTLDQILLSHPALWEEVYFNLDHFSEIFMQKNSLKTPVFLRFITLLKNASNHLNDKALDGKQKGKSAIKILVSTTVGRDILRKSLQVNIIDAKEVCYFGAAVISEDSLKMQVNGKSIRTWLYPVAELIMHEESARATITSKEISAFRRKFLANSKNQKNPLGLPDNILRLILEYSDGKDKIHQVSAQFLRLLIVKNLKNSDGTLLSYYLMRCFPNLNYRSKAYDLNKKRFIHLRKPYFLNKNSNPYHRMALAILDGKKKQSIFDRDLPGFDDSLLQKAFLPTLIFLSFSYCILFILNTSGFFVTYGFIATGQSSIVLKYRNEAITCKSLGDLVANTADFLWPNQERDWSESQLLHMFCLKLQKANRCDNKYWQTSFDRRIFSEGNIDEQIIYSKLLDFFYPNIMQLHTLRYYCTDIDFLSSEPLFMLSLALCAVCTVICVSSIFAYLDDFLVFPDEWLKKSNVKALEAFYDLTNLYQQREKNNTVVQKTNSLFHFFSRPFSNKQERDVGLKHDKPFAPAN